MKKIRKIVLMVLAVILLLGGFMGFRSTILGFRHFKSPLNEYEYSSGGGMDGGYDHLMVKKMGDEVYVYKTSTEWYSALPTTELYAVDGKLLSDIENVFYKNRMSGYNHLHKSPFEVLDARTDSYYFYFGEDSVRFSDDRIIPKKGYEAIRTINSIINGYLSPESKLPGLVVKDGEEDRVEFFESDEICVRIYDYGFKELTYEIHNGGDEEYKYDGYYELYLGEELIDSGYSANDPYPIGSKYNDDYTIHFDEFLKPGNYRLVVGEITVEFEIR